MNRTTTLFLASLALPLSILPGCAPIDQEPELDADTEEVAEAQSAIVGSFNLAGYFENRQVKPDLSLDRGVGAVPDHCPSGHVPILGGCWSWDGVVGAGCPSGKEMYGGLCYPTCPLAYTGVGPVCWLDTDALSGSCQAFYSPSLAAQAQLSNRALTFGLGAGLSAGLSQSQEVGVYYGEDGQYGCYTSECAGVVTDVGMDMSISFGNFDGVDVLTGDGMDLSAGAGIGVVGFTESLAFDESWNVVGFVQQISVGVGLSPLALGASSCETSLHELWGAHPALTPVDAPDPNPGNTVYNITAEGALQRSHHASNGGWDVVYQTIGSGWGGADHVFAAEGGHVYAIFDETLLYYHHDSNGNWDNWGTEIGSGWGGLSKVFAARFGEIYAIDAAGNLRRYTHDASLQFASSPIIGVGWNLPKVFGGGSGAFYIIDDLGDLYYYYYSPTQGWVHAGEKIGTGWGGLTTIGSTGNGEIYAVYEDGTVRLFRHDANRNWVIGSGAEVGVGWSFGDRGIIPAQY